MKKSLVSLALMVAATAFAGPGSQSSVSSEPGSPVSFAAFPRVLSFSTERNAISADGQLLVCRSQFKTKWGEDGCFDANGANAWSLAVYALPGWTLTAYEFRMPGAGGYRYLYLYFSK